MKSKFRIILKWTLRVVGALVLLLLAAYGVIYYQSEQRLNQVYQVTPVKLAIPTDSASLALGEHILAIRGCQDCHGKDLAGKVFIDDPGLGQVVASNLTSGKGGIGKIFTPEDWVKAIRHGVGTDNKPLLVMPSNEFFPMSNADLANLIGYLKSLPPVDNELPVHNLKPLARVLYIAGPLSMLTSAQKIDHTQEVVDKIEPAVNAEYGKYLAVGCSGCHGQDFKGQEMPIPGMKASANITSTGDLGKWTEEQFMTVLKTGKRPDGRQIDNKDMPWEATKNFKDDEMKAIFRYLQTLPGSQNLQTSAE
ncbi:c-type cytochrome [Rhodocytophaga aerolata]|uniref:C-type cytochrome n=1 Tax=Rhodocytophaga aerolata TaxID=455078 RepID=A0ABT8R6H3_9BACT|nr:c-type cytochrome [Rhodocytophaga aerolata]MDO1447706.1 c-type cytochrome [Rhodocytophaga aerolata]